VVVLGLLFKLSEHRCVDQSVVEGQDTMLAKTVLVGMG